MFDRRTVLKASAACAALTLVTMRTRFAYAAIPDAILPQDRRFVVVILRGGLDGLAAVPAHGDPDYASLRGALALPKTGVGAPIDLDGMFGLHPSLHHLSEMWQDKELAVFHNVSTPYRDRSHFDAQNVLETGGLSPHLLREGWLNRALPPLGLDGGNGALAVASSPPLLLDGAARVASWLPSRMPAPDEEFMARVGQLYAHDPVFAAALREALETRATAGAAMHDMKPVPAAMVTDGTQAPKLKAATAAAGGGYDAIAPLMEGAGKILAADNGPRVAIFDITGWDTHFNQGAGDGQLARRLQALDQGLFRLKTSLGPVWRKTVIAAASEFGRTVKVNGTGGTDHGTAGIAFLMGGAVKGGSVHAEWTGLKASALKDGRDLPPRTDTRAIFKAVLADHLGVGKKVLEDRIFPDSASAVAIPEVIRA